MTKKDIKIAKILKNQLSEIVTLTDFRIYGSRARGDAERYSDLDVFVVVESLDRRLEDKIIQIAINVGRDNSMFIEPLIFTKDEIENSPMKYAPIVENIYEEGIII